MAIDVNKLIITQIDQITCYNNTGALEFILDEIQNGTISNTQEKTDVTGKGGRKIASLKKNKAVTITATNGVVCGGAIAAQTGSDVEQGKFKVRKTEIIVINSNKGTVVGSPVGTTGAEIGYAYIKNPSGSLGTKFEQKDEVSATAFTFNPTNKEIAFNADAVKDGEEIVVFYDEEVEAAKITNDSEKYSKVLKMYVDVTAQDNCDQQFHGQFIIQRADFSGEFSYEMGGDPTTQQIEAESLAGGCTGSTNLWDFIVY